MYLNTYIILYYYIIVSSTIPWNLNDPTCPWPCPVQINYLYGTNLTAL